MKKLLFILLPVFCFGQTSKQMAAYGIWTGSTDSVKVLGSQSGKTYNVWGIDIAGRSSAGLGRYIIKPQANTDITTLLQTAVNAYKYVLIDGSLGTGLISNTITIPSGVKVEGINGATIKASTTRSGTLSSVGRYLSITGNGCRVTGITFAQASNLTAMSTWSSSVIYIPGADNIIENNTFNFSMAYGNVYNAVWISTANGVRNVVRDNKISTLGVTYSENGASYNTVERNYINNSCSNALSGIGNQSSGLAVGNKVLNNIIYNAGRMGIEDQQKISGTEIIGNTFDGSGQDAGVALGEKLGISVVAMNTIVERNIIRRATNDYIEVRGRSNIRVAGNDIYDANGTEDGIIINFTSSAASDLTNVNTIISANKIVGAKTGIHTFGEATETDITISQNTIINCRYIGIETNTGSQISSRLVVSGNTISFNNSFLSAPRSAIITFTTVPSGSQKLSYVIEKNTVTFSAGAGSGSGITVSVDKAIVAYNIVYGNGSTYSFINNGSTTSGVRLFGNSAFDASNNVASFTNKYDVANNF